VLKQLLFASAILLPIGAQATPMDEATRTDFIGGAMKGCMAEVNGNEMIQRILEKRLWSQKDLSNYCGCYSVTAASKTRLEDINYVFTNGENSSEMNDRIVNPSAIYCKRYLPLVDVSDIKDKKW